MATGQNGIATFKNIAALPAVDFTPLEIPNRAQSVWGTSLCAVEQNFPIYSRIQKVSEDTGLNASAINVKGYRGEITTSEKIPNKCVKYSNITYSKQDLYSTTRAIQINEFQAGLGYMSIKIDATVQFDDPFLKEGVSSNNYVMDEPITNIGAGIHRDALKWDTGQSLSWFDSEAICVNQVILYITVNESTSVMPGIGGNPNQIEFTVRDSLNHSESKVMKLSDMQGPQSESLTYNFSVNNRSNLPLKISFEAGGGGGIHG